MRYRGPAKLEETIAAISRELRSLRAAATCGLLSIVQAQRLAALEEHFLAFSATASTAEGGTWFREKPQPPRGGVS